MASDVTRVEIGFDGGLIVITKIAAAGWTSFETALQAGKGVVEFVGDDENTTYHVDVSKISYVKHEKNLGRVGF